MRVEEAIALLRSLGEPMVKDVLKLYFQEFSNRVMLRGEGKNITKPMVEGILKEMDEWILKVAKGLDLKDDVCEKMRVHCRNVIAKTLQETGRMQAGKKGRN